MRTGNPKLPTSDMCLGGVYYAIVTQNKDDEKGLARVKVRLPWMPGGGQDQTHWARISAPLIGAEFGAYTLPEVDDTVLVMFVAGDIRWPVIIGGVWNKADTPPEVNQDGNNDFRFIKSRAGHRMLLDDSAKTKVVLADFKNTNSLGLGDFASGGSGDSAFEIPVADAINGGKSKGVSATASKGALNLWCPKGTLTINAKNVEITASDKADFKAGGDMKLSGGSMGTVNGTGGVKLDGSKVKIN